MPARRRSLHARLTRLEDRLTPASATLTAGVLTVSYTATGTTVESATLSNDGSAIALDDGGPVSQEFLAAAVNRIVVQDTGGGTQQALTFAGSVPFTLPGGLTAAGVESI